MTWTPHHDAPHSGASGDGDLGSSWALTDPDAVPLAPGALGADPDAPEQPDHPELPPLPLTGPLAEALATARAALDEAHASACWTATLGPHQRLQALAAVATARHVADATLVRLLSTFTTDDLTAVGATTAVDLLLTHTGADPKRAATEARLAKTLPVPALPLLAPEPDAGDAADADAARCDDPVSAAGAVALARLGEAHATGSISTDNAAFAVRAVTDLPARVRKLPGAVAAADQLLADTLPGATHATTRQVCAQLTAVLDPDRGDRGFDPDDLERRYLRLVVHSDGWTDLHARFDPVTGAAIKAVIDHHATPDPAATAPLADDSDDEDDGGAAGSAVVVRDERTAEQRRADALADLLARGAGNTTRGGEPPRVVVTTTDAQLRGQPGAGQARCETTDRPLARAALAHLVCTGVVQALRTSCEGPAGAVLELGRTVRLFTASQRRAMLARDGGCVIPGCTAVPARLEAHHVHGWAAGGLTDVGNGVLVCSRHHVLVTLGVWQVRMVDGAPQVRPPASVDAARRWVLNPRPAVADATTSAARQLLLVPDGDWADDPPPPVTADSRPTS